MLLTETVQQLFLLFTRLDLGASAVDYRLAGYSLPVPWQNGGEHRVQAIVPLLCRVAARRLRTLRDF